MGIIDYFKISGPSEKKVPAAAVQKTYKKFAMQSFLAGTLGYSGSGGKPCVLSIDFL